MFSFAKRVAEGYRNGRSCCVNFVIHGRNLEIMLASVGAVGNEAFGNDPGRRCTWKATRRKGIRWLMCCLGLCCACMAVEVAGAPFDRTSATGSPSIGAVCKPSNHGMPRQVGGGGSCNPFLRCSFYNSRLPHMITCYALPEV